MAPSVTITGNFKALDGSAVSTGTVTAQLVGYGSDIPRVAGVGVIDVGTISATISGGAVTLGPIYSNGDISPVGTFYMITFPAPTGTGTAGGTITKNYSLPSAGTFDLSQLTPIGAPLNIGPAPVNAVTPQVFSPITNNFLTGLNSQGQFSSAQPSASNLSDGTTGTGAVVRATSPTLTTPAIGAATATTVNKVTLTAPATGSTLTIADGKTLTANNTLTLAGTDGTTLTFQGADTYVGRATTDTLTNKTIDTAGPNTLKIAGTSLTAVTGSGNVVLATSPTLGGTVPYNRIRANQGSALVSGDWTLGGNWGTSPSLGSIMGTDSAGAVTVTAGTGSPGANPTLSLTFHDGAWPSAPIVVFAPGGGNPPWNITSRSTTGFTVTFAGTPGAGNLYGFNFIAVGIP